MIAGLQLTPYSLISGFDKQIQPKLGDQRAVNLYVIYSEDQENPPALYDLPGIRTVANVGDDPTQVGRGLITQGDYLYAVYGNSIYRLDENLVQTPIGGTLATDQGAIRIDKDEDQLLFVDNVEGYLYNFVTETATFPIKREGDAAGFPFQPKDVTYILGYFIVIQGQSNNWFWSSPNDGLKWNALNFNKMNSQGDVCIAVAFINNKLFIFGETICQQWYLDPVSNDEPFQLNTNMLFPFGTAATASVIVNYGYLVWLSSTSNGVVDVKMSVNGAYPQSISSQEINYVFREYARLSTVSDATAMIYMENGHIFYEITFKAANATWVCDITSPNPQESWFEREMNTGDRFVGEFYCNFKGKNYVCSSVDNRLFEMSSRYGDYDGENFCRRIIGSTYQAKSLKKTTISRWQFDLMMGTGSSNGVNANPHGYLSISNDGGETFGNSIPANVGKIGKRTRTFYFDKVGTSRMFTPMLEFYNNVPTAVVSSVITGRECKR